MAQAKEDPSVSFSDLLECTLISWAPDGVYLAHTANSEILIRNTKDEMSILNSFKTAEKLDQLEWSADSSYLAAASFTEGILRIYCCEEFSWNCAINMGDEWSYVGMQAFCWNANPMVHQLITTADNYIQLTIWSLMDSTAVYKIKNPLPTEANKSFSGDGKQLAVAQYCPPRNYAIGIFSTTSWEKESGFIFQAKEFQGLKWCPDKTSILVWDSMMYSTWYIYSLNGDLLKSCSPDGMSLGIHAIEWSPTGELFAFTNHSNTLRIVNGHMPFGLLMEYCLTGDLLLDFPECMIHTEELKMSHGCGGEIRHYEYSSIVAKELVRNSPPSHSNPKRQKSTDQNQMDKYLTNPNSSKVKFSEGGYLAAWTKKFPKKLWLWDLQEAMLCAVIVQRHKIQDFAWAPEGNMLCLTTGFDCIYFWSPEDGCFAKKIPEDENFNAVRINWNDYANAVAISSDRFTVCRLNGVS